MDILSRIWGVVAALALCGLPGPLLAAIALFATCLSFAWLDARQQAALRNAKPPPTQSHLRA